MQGEALTQRSTVGFACSWGPDQQRTWSGTPYRLRQALADTGPLVNLDVDLPASIRIALKIASIRRFDERWVSMWRHNKVFRDLTEHRLRAAARRNPCDAVVTVHDLGAVPGPYLVLQDFSYESLVDHYGPNGVPHFPTLDRSALQRLQERQSRVYDRAAGLLPMSHWLAERLVAAGVDRAKVFPVHPGLNVPVGAAEPIPERRVHPTRRLLFVGRDPHTKALDVLVAAFARLRLDLGPTLTLTVAGPVVWPWPQAIPAGVDFLGPVSRDRVAELMNTHDLFVMPSRLEGFGIVFAEALARGLPCIGRRAFAMPEIIRPGVGGNLLDGDDPEDLAALIASTLDDDDLYHRCAADVARIREHFNWTRAAVEIRGAVQAVTV